MLTPRVFQLFDTSLPIGSFNHSFGIEEAYYAGLEVTSFIEDIFQSVILPGDVQLVKLAFSDPYRADQIAYASKLTPELKNATVNLGSSLASLGLCENDFIRKVKNGETYGTYPVVIAVCCKELGIGVDDCMVGLAYSELVQLVYSAVRLKAINFIEGQKLITRLLEKLRIENTEFKPFSPVLDNLSKNHEVREPKVFMS
ncbi:urease accessory protein UreF [Stygiolobus caldivivus]|uniref:Urease accessory protein UreF n=1 Tax=Stygiolobus caldivivus TaxID=2824673 RepID=A0A8D5UAC6_9CREN|nr:urease accessory UreF family protein [Stygiolobus caldivivus]BCU71616.1 urease accessory protein UreF [Stygiolobus caldivivus]